MSFSILEHFGIKPITGRFPSRVLDCPSGAVVELDVNEDVLRIDVPGSYAFEAGRVVESASELSADDFRFICRVAAGLLSVLLDGTKAEHHRALAERQAGNIARFADRAFATDSAVLIVTPSSVLMPLLTDAFPSAVLAPLVVQAAATAAPLVLLLNRELLAATIEHTSTGTDFEMVAQGLRQPERGIMPVVHVVTSIGGHVSLLLFAVSNNPPVGKERLS